MFLGRYPLLNVNYFPGIFICIITLKLHLLYHYHLGMLSPSLIFILVAVTPLWWLFLLLTVSNPSLKRALPILQALHHPLNSLFHLNPVPIRVNRVLSPTLTYFRPVLSGPRHPIQHHRLIWVLAFPICLKTGCAQLVSLKPFHQHFLFVLLRPLLVFLIYNYIFQFFLLICLLHF